MWKLGESCSPRLKAEWQDLRRSQIQCRCSHCRQQMRESSRLYGLIGGDKPLIPVYANFWNGLLERCGGCATAAKYNNFVCVGPSLGSGENKQWDGLLLGPPNTPYFGGLFAFKITFQQDFPFRPPRVEIATDIHHPCVIGGHVSPVSVGILSGTTWTAAFTMSEILVALAELLKGHFPQDGAEHKWCSCWEAAATPYLTLAAVAVNADAVARYKAAARKKTALRAVDTQPV